MKTVNSLLNGSEKDKRNEAGRTFVEELAHGMFLDPNLAAKLTASANARARGIPSLKASIERAMALNAPKNALLSTLDRCKGRGPLQREEHEPPPNFYLDFPKKLHQLDPERYGPWCYLPTNWHHALIGTDGHSFSSRDDYGWEMWAFRRDPFEIEGAWSDQRGYFYTWRDKDDCKTDRAFLARYRDRLRRVLAEAVPGVGAL
jgi:hypothetical protein